MAGNRGSKKIHPRMQREALRFIVNKRLAPPYEDPSWREVKEHLDGWVRKTRFGLETGESFYDMGYTSPERSKIYSLTFSTALKSSRKSTSNRPRPVVELGGIQKIWFT